MRLGTDSYQVETIKLLKIFLSHLAISVPRPTMKLPDVMREYDLTGVVYTGHLTIDQLTHIGQA